MQYSGGQSIFPVSKDIILTPDEEPDVQGEEPTVKDDGEPIVQGEDETESEEQPTGTDPRKGVQSGLDIANTTQQTLLPAYKIGIQFYGIAAGYLSGGKNCADWSLAAYVQGKYVKLRTVYSSPLSDITVVCKVGSGPPVGGGSPLKDGYNQLSGGFVNINIPNDLVEGDSLRDYRPLSIFTVGWQHDSSTCPKFMNAPKELPEVQRILADYKGSTHADAKERIASIQHELQNQLSVGCSPTPPTATSYPKNQKLDTVNILLPAPTYGIKVAPEEWEKDPLAVLVKNCDTSPYCLSYHIYCPLCPVPRQD